MIYQLTENVENGAQAGRTALVEGVGAITLTGHSADAMTLFFETETGHTGSYSVQTQEVVNLQPPCIGYNPQPGIDPCPP